LNICGILSILFGLHRQEGQNQIIDTQAANAEVNIIKNALVIDGTASRPFEADLAGKGPKIYDVRRIGKSNAGMVIDAGGGCAVAPGFIDMHFHADFSLPVNPTADSLLHQGITSAVVGQCRLSPAPLLEETRQEVVGALGGFLGGVAQHLPWNKWNSFGDFLGFLTGRGISLNVLPLVGQGVIRASVMRYREGRANREQMEKMKAELRNALEQGAIGLSTGPQGFEHISLQRAHGPKFYALKVRRRSDWTFAVGNGQKTRIRDRQSFDTGFSGKRVKQFLAVRTVHHLPGDRIVFKNVGGHHDL
jgi:N-acyl-D-aspartate/D-glutamate deacylase